MDHEFEPQLRGPQMGRVRPVSSPGKPAPWITKTDKSMRKLINSSTYYFIESVSGGVGCWYDVIVTYFQLQQWSTIRFSETIRHYSHPRSRDFGDENDLHETEAREPKQISMKASNQTNLGTSTGAGILSSYFMHEVYQYIRQQPQNFILHENQ